MTENSQFKEKKFRPIPSHTMLQQLNIQTQKRVSSESAMVWNRLDTKPEKFKHAGIPLVTNNQNIF